MRKILFKTLLVISGALLILSLTFFVYYLMVTKDYHLDESKLVNLESSAEIYDAQGNFMTESAGGLNITDLKDVPQHTVNAFIAIEDKRFYKHNGIDMRGVIRAIFNNVKSFSFKEGASTISQQLIKNTHLSSDKTLNRKLAEMKLARELEKRYSKDEIIEKYLNTIYFGNGCYGISSAAEKYFGVGVSELSLNQSAILAGMIKAPSTYSPLTNPQKCFERKNVVLKEMYNQNLISEAEYSACVDSFEEISDIKTENSSYIYLVNKACDDILERSGHVGEKCKVYTYYDNNLQEILENSVKDGYSEYDRSFVILGNGNEIKAFYSTVGEAVRQTGSTIKPILVYAPAIEENVIDECSLINDERTDFGGYDPANYNDKYYGYVSAKFALAKSLNVCAVKVLNSTGLEKSKNYARKLGINMENADDSLRIALGSTEKGATLTQISAAYGAFVNKGRFVTPSVIDKIVGENGKIIYKNDKNGIKVFGEDTAFIINDCLKFTVTDGTAKYLNREDMPLCAKTGTVGNEKGNTDAYCVSYNGDYIISGWYGKADGSFMPNSVTGGSVPAKTLSDVWDAIYNSGYRPSELFSTDKVVRVNLDKISYEQEKRIELADENFPLRYVTQAYFKKNRVPKISSERFSSPKIENAEIEVINGEICIRLCLAEYCEYKIFRQNKNSKVLVCDSAFSKNRYEFKDGTVSPDTNYRYSVIPYLKNGDVITEGKEIFLPKIKTPRVTGGDWWLSDTEG